MKQFKLTLGFILLTIGIITFTGCSKYEEGPFFSLRTKRSRVVGDWKATSFTVNGDNFLSSSTAGVLDCLSGDMFNYTMTGTVSIDWTFEKDGKSTVHILSDYTTLDFQNSFTQCTPIYINSSDENTEEVTWDFSSNKEDIEITYTDGSKETWHIIELREKEMKLTMDDGTDKYAGTLEKK